LQLCKE